MTGGSRQHGLAEGIVDDGKKESIPNTWLLLKSNKFILLRSVRAS